MAFSAWVFFLLASSVAFSAWVFSSLAFVAASSAWVFSSLAFVTASSAWVFSSLAFLAASSAWDLASSACFLASSAWVISVVSDLSWSVFSWISCSKFSISPFFVSSSFISSFKPRILASSWETFVWSFAIVWFRFLKFAWSFVCLVWISFNSACFETKSFETDNVSFFKFFNSSFNSDTVFVVLFISVWISWFFFWRVSSSVCFSSSSAWIFADNSMLELCFWVSKLLIFTIANFIWFSYFWTSLVFFASSSACFNNFASKASSSVFFPSVFSWIEISSAFCVSISDFFFWISSIFWAISLSNSDFFDSVFARYSAVFSRWSCKSSCNFVLSSVFEAISACCSCNFFTKLFSFSFFSPICFSNDSSSWEASIFAPSILSNSALIFCISLCKFASCLIFSSVCFWYSACFDCLVFKAASKAAVFPVFESSSVCWSCKFFSSVFRWSVFELISFFNNSSSLDALLFSVWISFLSCSKLFDEFWKKEPLFLIFSIKSSISNLFDSISVFSASISLFSSFFSSSSFFFWDSIDFFVSWSSWIVFFSRFSWVCISFFWLWSETISSEIFFFSSANVLSSDLNLIFEFSKVERASCFWILSSASFFSKSSMFCILAFCSSWKIFKLDSSSLVDLSSCSKFLTCSSWVPRSSFFSFSAFFCWFFRFSIVLLAEFVSTVFVLISDSSLVIFLFLSPISDRSLFIRSSKVVSNCLGSPTTLSLLPNFCLFSGEALAFRLFDTVVFLAMSSFSCKLVCNSCTLSFFSDNWVSSSLTCFDSWFLRSVISFSFADFSAVNLFFSSFNFSISEFIEFIVSEPLRLVFCLDSIRFSISDWSFFNSFSFETIFFFSFSTYLSVTAALKMIGGLETNLSSR